MNEKSGAGARRGQSGGRAGGESWEVRPSRSCSARRRLRSGRAPPPRRLLSPGTRDPGPWLSVGGKGPGGPRRRARMSILGWISHPGVGGRVAASAPSRPPSSTRASEPLPAPRTAPSDPKSGRGVTSVTQLTQKKNLLHAVLGFL
ncbi:uncharacterized protein MIR9-1HG isoform X2 [Rhinolophus ferrumequinum]|uniref:uncharacterized protein MIR9-1HG isoform X2 n=1 Tax=Rhinolophus ferrumequinum TaxID=59479 RepID=UPI00140FB112|nr:uncharacterized protein MIR9-1HG isoform X2 [Rhinolophus ferrumequinum]